MTNKVAVVTGASSGIGKAIALRLAAAGFDVVAHAGQNEEAAKEVADLIRQLGRQTLVVIRDFQETSGLNAFVDTCWNWQGSVAAWVNNAGADVLTGEATQWDFERKLRSVFSVDVTATLLLSREVGKRMTKAFESDGLRRSIINIGWDQAERGMAGDSGEMFAASKGAIMASSRSLAQSLAPAVRVNCIAPGWIQTSWGETAPDTWQDRARGDCLLDRWGEPDDVAAVAAYLVSDAAEFVNGQVLCVNGGFRFGSRQTS